MRAWLVFVGNGHYGEGFSNLVERDSLTSSTLDVRVIRADRRGARSRVVAAILMGRMARSTLIEAREARAVSVDVAGPRVDVALDGEVESLEVPLEFSIQRGGLKVLAVGQG